MNTKTTLYLAVGLVVLGALYAVVQSRPAPDEADAAPRPGFGTSAATRDLIEDKLGDVVKVVYRRRDREEWIFEKNTEDGKGTQAVWRMTSPLQMKCVTWEVNKFANRLGSLKYELSYKPGEPGAVTASQAGLDPPEATLRLTDADGRTVSVDLGKQASNRETYVRLVGSNEIIVGKADLKDLHKDRPFDFRDKQLWSFEKGDVTRVEITDRSEAGDPVSYTFSRDGSRWMMEAPVSAGATSKVDDMLAVMGRLRAIEWQDDDAGKLAAYGLDPAAMSIHVTVEKQVPIEPGALANEPTGEESDDEEEQTEEDTGEKKTETEVTVYELHLSERSPIGEDTKTYMRVGDESTVATIMKYNADKFKPVMNEWREMRVTTAKVDAAIRIELTTREGSATLAKKDGDWRFAPDDGLAEGSAVSELLGAVAKLTAVVFIDEQPADPAVYGLDDPQAVLELTIPGAESVERIAIGGYTDPKSKRMVYVRRNDVTSVAKVRTSDVAKLIRGPRTYRDRTIVDVLPSRFERIALSTENRFVPGRHEIVLERSGTEWNMVEPVNAAVKEEQVDKLIETLGGLRAERIVTDTDGPSAYGLHDAAVTVTLTYKPPTEHRIEPTEGDSDGDDGDPQKVTPVEVQPSSRTLTLAVTEHDGKHYAKLTDRPTVYEVSADFYHELIAEYRTDRVLEFDDAEVGRFSIRSGENTHVFVRVDERWTYQAEPDLPLDDSAVKNLLLQIRDLRTPRYVRYTADDPAAFGLSTPAHEVTVTLDDGTVHTLLVSKMTGSDGTDNGFYAMMKNRGDVFLLPPDATKRLEVSLEDLERPTP